MSRVPNLTRPKRLAFAVAGGAAALLALTGGIYLHSSQTSREKADAARIRKALALVPPGASVAASIVFEPHLSHRTDLYTFPEPFVPIDWGGSSTRAELKERSRGVRYVVFIAGGGPIEYPSRLKKVSPFVRREGFRPIYRDGNIVVLERRK